ncbi:leucine aminopeptidase-related [Holotrichia oblita]|uniref:Leucine aminopeptidase-related n=1 Tax=Holotrichia oblita TaxID=644536 RepID=A0ACB9SQX0_HOLOL|nr:leucine aminopeptidase-related [Holotrichia oblita]
MSEELSRLLFCFSCCCFCSFFCFFLYRAGNQIKEGKCLTFWGLDPEYECVAVVGLGKSCRGFDEIEVVDQDKEAVRIAAAAGYNALHNLGVKNIVIESFGDAESAAEGATLASWRYQDLKSKKKEESTLDLIDPQRNECAQWEEGLTKANAQNLARTLAETPANLMTPTIFASKAGEILKPLGCEICPRDKSWAENKKMGGFLSVAKGSVEPPVFLEVHYKGGGDNTFVLIGKGVTFDAGGISIKPSANMADMRADMGGGAAVVGTIFGLASLKAKVNVVALIPLVENLPSGNAVKPGDVIKAMNGKSICVDNTDAEGRLILADALCYSKEFDPAWVLDIATLTGAMTVALGDAATGVFTNSNELYGKLEQAGARTGDRMWKFPLWKRYSELVTEYPFYDVHNVGKGKGGGSCKAAAFLREFVPEKVDWLHLDMASVMGPGKSAKYLSEGMQGRPTRTLIEFVRGQCLS